VTVNYIFIISEESIPRCKMPF